MGTFEPSQKKSSHTASSPIATSLFRSRSSPKPSATVEEASTDTPDFQARWDFARSHAPNLNSLAANSSGDRAPSTIQPKLTVGAPNDQYEQEADRVADQVMSMPDAATQQPLQREAMPEEELQTKPLAAGITPLVQRETLPEEEEAVQTKASGNADIQREVMPEEEEVQTKPLASDTLQREEMAPEEEDLQMKSLGTADLQREAIPEEEDALQTKSLGTADLQREALPEEDSLQTKASPTPHTPHPTPSLESQLSNTQGSGSPLPNDVRSFMEPRFGADFSQVRVHTGSESVQMNRDLNAQAFTHKQDVYFGAGKAPGNNSLTAHELTHVVQQIGHPQAKVNQGSPCPQNLPKVASASAAIQMKRRPGEVPEGQARTDAAEENLQNRLLFDFDVDDATLKPVHTASLDEMLKFISADFEKRRESTEPLWLIGVDGFATHTGTAEHNQALSQAREENTFKYINNHLFDNIRPVDADSFESRIVRDPKFHGFNKTTVEGENPLGRSVQVLMKRPNLPALPPPKPPSQKRATRFQIRCLSFSSTSVPVPLVPGLATESDFANYEIVDQNNRTAKYSYKGNGIGVFIPKLPSVSGDNPGTPQKFVSFETTKPIQLEDFAGSAQVVQPPSLGSIPLPRGGFGDPELAFKGPKFGLGKVQTKPRHVEVPTGTEGLTVFTSTEGELTMLSSSP